MSSRRFPELSCYLLPGHTKTPADAMDEARQAVEQGAAKAGRNAEDIRICSVMATVLEPTREEHLKKPVGGMVT